MQPLTIRQPRPDPAATVEDIYDLADRLDAIERLIIGRSGLGGFWRDLPPARLNALSAILGTFDFMMTARAVREFADGWQAELDAEEA